MSAEATYVQKDAGGGHAWSVSSEAASEYLRARIPYTESLIDYMFAFHEGSSKGSAKFDAVLDLGCGPGQLAIHMSRKFKKVYCRDISEKMLAIARTLPQMEEEELQDVCLFKPRPECIFDYGLGKENALNMPDNSVDMIVSGATPHWFDWSTDEKSRAIWKEWARVLRPNGTFLATVAIPAPGSGSGVEGQKTRPLRQMLRNMGHTSELAKYYNRWQIDLVAGTLYNSLPMPWQVGFDEKEQVWNPLSKLFMVFDNTDDVTVQGHPVPTSDPIPNWMPAQVSKYITTPQSIGQAYEQIDRRWKTTSPRKIAAWIRSASCYVHHLRDNPEEKLRIGRDDDLAARMVKQVCQEGDLAYDETIELHNPSAVVAIRKN